MGKKIIQSLFSTSYLHPQITAHINRHTVRSEGNKIKKKGKIDENFACDGSNKSQIKGVLF